MLGATIVEAGDPDAVLDIDRALDLLRPAERLCVVLSFSEGMSHAEIAAETGFKLGTVKSHLTRGTAKLRTLLEPVQGQQHESAV